MERAHYKTRGNVISHEIAYALLHLSCRLVSKRQSEYVPRFNPLLHQICYFICQHTSLTRTGTSNNQRRPVAVFHSQPLRFIKVFQQIHIL